MLTPVGVSTVIAAAFAREVLSGGVVRLPGTVVGVCFGRAVGGG